jgi:choline dehydrogenase
MEAYVEAGIPLSKDVNGEKQEGVEVIQLTTRDGRRCSASVAYLHPAMRRPNLRVETGAHVLRVLFDGRRAVAVEFEQDGVRRTVRARREVILSGGVVNSPQLLELSGIGDAQRLAALGIPVLVDSPRVGENLQDHFNVPMVFRLNPGVRSLNDLARPTARWRALARYFLTSAGVLAEGACYGTAFVKSRAELAEPDVKFVIMALSMGWRTDASGRTQFAIDEQPGLTLAPAQIRPESRGSIHIRSPDPKAPPAIIPNYLSDSVDQRVVVAALRLGRRIAQQRALNAFIAQPIAPGLELQSDEELLGFARQTGTSGFHGAGTCHMGSGPDSVLDPQLRVRGVEGLRVVDASIMPRLVSGNTNAPTIMIGERAADLILERRVAGVAEPHSVDDVAVA